MPAFIYSSVGLREKGDARFDLSTDASFVFVCQDLYRYLNSLAHQRLLVGFFYMQKRPNPTIYNIFPYYGRKCV